MLSRRGLKTYHFPTLCLPLISGSIAVSLWHVPFQWQADARAQDSTEVRVGASGRAAWPPGTDTAYDRLARELRSRTTMPLG
jgi:hypothetical protein